MIWGFHVMDGATAYKRWFKRANWTKAQFGASKLGIYNIYHELEFVNP